MKDINDFFSKFSFLRNKNQEQIAIIKSVVLDLYLIELGKGEIQISNGILKFNAHPMIRQRLLNDKKRLIDELKEKGLDIWNIK